MCQFKSVWLTPDGDLLHSEFTDSHDILARFFKIRDLDQNRDLRAIRLEFTWPQDGDLLDLSRWILQVDEDSKPEWATDDVLARAREQLVGIVERSIVRDSRDTIFGGVWLIAPSGRIGELIGGRIVLATDADLTGANLTRSDLTRAYLTGANLTWAYLTEAKLTGANLTGANLTRANLTGANLMGADLAGANLTRANLTRANFAGANLTGANLTGANLTGANLTGADLAGANLTGARSNCAYDGWTLQNGVLVQA
jgi:hypothetical protein